MLKHLGRRNPLRAQCSTVIAQWEPSFDSPFWADTRAVNGGMWELGGHQTRVNAFVFLPTHGHPPAAVLAVLLEGRTPTKAFESVSVHLLLLLFFLAEKGKVPLKHCYRGNNCSPSLSTSILPINVLVFCKLSSVWAILSERHRI